MEQITNSDTKSYIDAVVHRSMDGLKAVLANGINDQSQEIKLLNQALSKAQGQLSGALKDSEQPFYNSKYADLESVWGVAREPLADNGLAVTQTPCKDGTHLVTHLLHESGQWTKGYWPILTAKKDSQGFMGSVTYARRGALSAMLGIYQTDDDGHTASDRCKHCGKTEKSADTENTSGNVNPPPSPKKNEQTRSKFGSVKTPTATASTSESDAVVKMAREVFDAGTEKLSQGKIQSLQKRLEKLPPEKNQAFLTEMSIKVIDDLRKDEFGTASKALSKMERAS